MAENHPDLTDLMIEVLGYSFHLWMNSGQPSAIRDDILNVTEVLLRNKVVISS
jgi:hypothetical protein